MCPGEIVPRVASRLGTPPLLLYKISFFLVVPIVLSCVYPLPQMPPQPSPPRRHIAPAQVRRISALEIRCEEVRRPSQAFRVLLVSHSCSFHHNIHGLT